MCFILYQQEFLQSSFVKRYSIIICYSSLVTFIKCWSSVINFDTFQAKTVQYLFIAYLSVLYVIYC